MAVVSVSERRCGYRVTDKYESLDDGVSGGGGGGLLRGREKRSGMACVSVKLTSPGSLKCCARISRAPLRSRTGGKKTKQSK